MRLKKTKQKWQYCKKAKCSESRAKDGQRWFAVAENFSQTLKILFFPSNKTGRPTKSKSPQPTGLLKVLAVQEKHSAVLNCSWPVCGRQAVRSSPLPQSLTTHSHKQSYVLCLSRTLYLITTFAHTLYLSQPSTHRFWGRTYTHTHTHAHAQCLFCYKRTWVWTRPQKAHQRCCFKKTLLGYEDRWYESSTYVRPKHLDGLLMLGCGAGHELHPPMISGRT